MYEEAAYGLSTYVGMLVGKWCATVGIVGEWFSPKPTKSESTCCCCFMEPVFLCEEYKNCMKRSRRFYVFPLFPPWDLLRLGDGGDVKMNNSHASLLRSVAAALRLPKRSNAVGLPAAAEIAKHFSPLAFMGCWMKCRNELCSVVLRSIGCRGVIIWSKLESS